MFLNNRSWNNTNLVFLRQSLESLEIRFPVAAQFGEP